MPQNQKPSPRKQLSTGIDGIERTSEADVIISLNVTELFSSPLGKSVLKYLRSITIERVNGPSVSTESLHHIEGQRYIVGLLENRIEQGHRSKNK